MSVSSYTKSTLSASPVGKQILLNATASASAVLIHTAATTTSLDEVYLYAYNDATSSVLTSILWGGNTEPNDVTRVSIPSRSGRTILADGKLLTSGSITAYTDTGSFVSIDGFVNRIINSDIDPFVASWAQRVVTNGGSLPSTSTQVAISTFYRGLVNYSLFTKMATLNCYAPDNLIACITPLITRDGNDPWTNHNFVSSDLTVNGLKGDGSSKYLDMNFNFGHFPSIISSTNAGATVYNFDAFNSSSTTGYAIGVGGAANSSQFALYADTAGVYQAYLWRFVNVGQDFLQGTSPSFGAYFSSNRTGASRQDVYLANSFTPHSASATGTGTQTGAIIADQPVIAHAINAVGSITGFCNGRLSFLAVHSGLSTTDSVNFFNLIQQLRISFGGGYV